MREVRLVAPGHAVAQVDQFDLAARGLAACQHQPWLALCVRRPVRGLQRERERPFARPVPRVPLHDLGLLTGDVRRMVVALRSEEHTSELQSLMRIAYAVFCLKNKTKLQNT